MIQKFKSLYLESFILFSIKFKANLVAFVKHIDTDWPIRYTSSFNIESIRTFDSNPSERCIQIDFPFGAHSFSNKS